MLLIMLLSSLPVGLRACAATAPATSPTTSTILATTAQPTVTTTAAGGGTPSSNPTTSTSSTSTTTTTTTTTVDKKLTCPLSPLNTPPASLGTRPATFSAVTVVNGANTVTVTCTTTNAVGTNVQFSNMPGAVTGILFGPPMMTDTWTLTCDANGVWTVTPPGMQPVEVYGANCSP